MLGKKKRRLKIILQWHSVYMNESQLYQFVDQILHTPIRLSLHLDYLCIFENQTFPIRYTWLDETEQNMILEMYDNREMYFQVKTMQPVFLTQCKVAGMTLLQQMHRREIIRDLITIGCIKNDAFARNLFILLFQKMMIARKKECDIVVYSFHHALQQNWNVADCICCR